MRRLFLFAATTWRGGVLDVSLEITKITTVEIRCGARCASDSVIPLVIAGTGRSVAGEDAEAYGFRPVSRKLFVPLTEAYHSRQQICRNAILAKICAIWGDDSGIPFVGGDRMKEGSRRTPSGGTLREELTHKVETYEPTTRRKAKRTEKTTLGTRRSCETDGATVPLDYLEMTDSLDSPAKLRQGQKVWEGTQFYPLDGRKSHRSPVKAWPGGRRDLPRRNGDGGVRIVTLGRGEVENEVIYGAVAGGDNVEIRDEMSGGKSCERWFLKKTKGLMACSSTR
uniref:Uncharacterized protein n=1 Tax=Ananas comosus var. bracteatus TaxID=296719 RepID=A0A6V7Q5K8_ANACO|nr:unnamed protein product [Ananas comosus var. bracteatus]